MTDSQTAAEAQPARTLWLPIRKTPLRQFLQTETGSAAILAGGVLVALIWSNVAAGSYERLWSTPLDVRVDSHGLSMDLRTFVNSGLMALFFLVVGLEARREFDMGELRVRSRLTLPVLAGLGGMIVPIVIFLAINAGQPTAHGWGTAMSTDTAFALGALALAGKGLPDRVRTYLLTFAVVDDLGGIVVIACFYSSNVRWMALVIGALLLVAYGVLSRRGIRNGPVYALIGVACWVAFFKSGVDPIVSGLVIGLLTCAYPANREDLHAGHRDVPAVPRAAHRPAGRRGPRGGARRDLAERAAAGALPPVDQLRDRPAVRAGQRGHQDQRLVPGARLHLPRHARHHDRLPGRQADRHRGRRLAGHQADRRAGCPRRSAGGRSPAPARSPGSGSPSRC